MNCSKLLGVAISCSSIGLFANVLPFQGLADFAVRRSYDCATKNHSLDDFAFVITSTTSIAILGAAGYILSRVGPIRYSVFDINATFARGPFLVRLAAQKYEIAWYFGLFGIRYALKKEMLRRCILDGAQFTYARQAFCSHCRPNKVQKPCSLCLTEADGFGIRKVENEKEASKITEDLMTDVENEKEASKITEDLMTDRAAVHIKSNLVLMTEMIEHKNDWDKRAKWQIQDEAICKLDCDGNVSSVIEIDKNLVKKGGPYESARHLVEWLDHPMHLYRYGITSPPVFAALLFAIAPSLKLCISLIIVLCFALSPKDQNDYSPCLLSLDVCARFSQPTFMDVLYMAAIAQVLLPIQLNLIFNRSFGGWGFIVGANAVNDLFLTKFITWYLNIVCPIMFVGSGVWAFAQYKKGRNERLAKIITGHRTGPFHQLMLAAFNGDGLQSTQEAWVQFRSDIGFYWWGDKWAGQLG